MRPLEALAHELVHEGLAPNVALGCSARRERAWCDEVGGEAGRLFDLASLTKPMTAVAVVLAGIDRRTRLGELVPELRATKSGDVSVELLLAHRAGLEAHIPVYRPVALGGTIEPMLALREAANARRVDVAVAVNVSDRLDEFAPVYSDLGYALVGQGLARFLGVVDAGAAIERLVVAPLGLEGVLGTARGLAALGVDVEGTAAPTEEVDWRGGLVRGRVHDENAWALTRTGGSGHAGMFGTVTAILRFGEAVLDGLSGEGPFGAYDLSWLVAERPGGTLRAGFDGKSALASSAGARFGGRSFGHLGFTGTSVWIDPDAGVVASLLTNRVHPSRMRAADAIKVARPRAHDVLHEVATGLGRPWC